MIDDSKIVEIQNSIESNVSYFTNITDRIVLENTIELDSILNQINTNIIQVDNPPVDVIEKYFLQLTNHLYFMQERVERLSIYDSISKINYKEVYNRNYLNPVLEKPKPSVSDITSYAENATIYEQSMSEMYNKAYKIVRSKVEAAQLMVQTLSKVLSKRMNDTQLSNRDNPFYMSNNGRILNE